MPPPERNMSKNDQHQGIKIKKLKHQPYGMNLLTYYEAILMFISIASLLIMIVPDGKSEAMSDVTEYVIVGIGLLVLIPFGILAVHRTHTAHRDLKPGLMTTYFLYKPAFIALVLIESVYHWCHHYPQTKGQRLVEVVLKVAIVIVLLFNFFTAYVGVKMYNFIASHAKANEKAYKTPQKF